MDRIGQFPLAGTIKKQPADDGCMGLNASEDHAVMPIQSIDVRDVLANDISRTQIVDTRLGFVVKEDSAAGVRNEDALVKRIEHRQKIEKFKVRRNRSVQGGLWQGSPPWLDVNKHSLDATAICKNYSQ